MSNNNWAEDPTIPWSTLWTAIRPALVKLNNRAVWGRNNPDKQRKLDKDKYARRKLRLDWHNVTARRVRNWRHNQGEQGRVKAAQAMKQWRDDNPEHFHAYRAQYYKTNAEIIKAAVHQYRKTHPEWQEANKRWAAQHPDKMRAAALAYRHRKRGALGTWTQYDIDYMLSVQGGRCVYCKADLKFGVQIDHILAVKRGGTNWPSNLQLLCASCNRRKHTKTDAEFRELMLT